MIRAPNIAQNKIAKFLIPDKLRFSFITMRVTSSLLAASATAANADIAAHLIAADASFWSNAAKITGSADAILRAVSLSPEIKN
jgi:hypothetical protein